MEFDSINILQCKIPAWTWFPICSSDIVNKFPFSSFIFAIDGKHFFFFGTQNMKKEVITFVTAMC